MAGNDRTLNLLQELEHDYESIMGLRTGIRTNHTNSTSYFSVEEEIAYLHERIDQMNRSQIHHRLRSSSNVSNATLVDASTQTNRADAMYHRNNVAANDRNSYTNYDLGNTSHQNEYASTFPQEIPENRTEFNDAVTPCHFCGGSGVDLSQFAAYKWTNGDIPFPAPFHPKQTQRTRSTSNHDNKRHISWAFIDVGDKGSPNPKVSHIYMELSTSPLQTTDRPNQQHCQFETVRPNPEYYGPNYDQSSESSSKFSCSESELDLREEDESEDFSESESASGYDDYVTLRRSNFTYRHPSFGTSVEFADGEDNYNGSADQEGEVSPFVNFVSKLDNAQETSVKAGNVSIVKEQKRILKPSYKQIHNRRPTPGPTGYLYNAPRGEDENRLQGDDVIDLDLDDPELHEAAVKMQAAFKGFNTRKKLEQNIKDNEYKPNCESVSKYPQGHEEANEEIDIDLNDPEVEMAAVKMQAAFKGFSARKKNGLKKNNQAPIEPKIVAQSVSGLQTALTNGADNAILTEGRNGDQDDLEDIDLNDPELAAAATKMQAAFKGFNARKKMGLATKAKSPPVAPSFEEEMFFEVSEDGSSVRLKCKLASMKPAPRVTWYQNDSAIDVDSNPDQRIWCAIEKEYCMLTIYDVDDDDSGVFTCKATSSAGEAKTTGELDCYEDSISGSDDEEVISASGSGTYSLTEEDSVSVDHEELTSDLNPSFTFKPQSRVVERGMTAKFICGVQGSPAPEVKWFIDGSQLQNDGIKLCIYDDVDEFLGNVAVLEINYANDSDEGEYICTASNDQGQVYCSAELTIEEPDEEVIPQHQYVEDEHGTLYNINGFGLYEHFASDVGSTGNLTGQQQPLVIFGEEGSSTKFHSTFRGPNRPLLTWAKDGIAIKSTDRVVQYEGDHTFGLEIAHIRQTDVGVYSCRALLEEQEGEETEICNFQLVIQDDSDTENEPILTQYPVMSSIVEDDSQDHKEAVDPCDEMRDSGYSQALSSNVSQTDGCQEHLNSNSEHNSTTCSKLHKEEERELPEETNVLVSSKMAGLQDEERSPPEDTISKRNLDKLQSNKAAENNPKKKTDSGRERRQYSRRHSSPSKLTTPSGQKEAKSRRRRDRERRRSSQTVEYDKKPGQLGSFDQNIPKNGTKRTRYSLPPKLEDLDDSFDRISKLNSRLNSKVDSCLSLVDSVLELNTAAFDPEQASNLQAKLRELSASLSDENLSNDNFSSDEDVRKKVAIKENGSLIYDVENEKNQTATCITPVAQENDLMGNEPLPATRQLQQSNLASPNSDHEIEMPVDQTPATYVERQVESTAASEIPKDDKEGGDLVDDPGSVIVSDGSDSDDVSRPRLNTVPEENEDSDHGQVEIKDGDVGKLAANKDRSPTNEQNRTMISEEVTELPVTKVIQLEESTPLQSALHPVTVPFSSFIDEPLADVNLDERVPSSLSLTPSSPSLSRKLSVDELLALDSLPESTIDSTTPSGSPVRKPKEDLNQARNALDALVQDSEKISKEDSDLNLDSDEDINQEKCISLWDPKRGEDIESKEVNYKVDAIRNDDEEALFPSSHTNNDPTNKARTQEQNQPEISSSKCLEFTQHLQDTLVLNGDALKLEVCISGSPLPSVRWYKGKKVISDDHCEMSHDGVDKWCLVIRKVTRDDEGMYVCEASGGSETVSSTCYLQVMKGLFQSGTSTGEDSEYSTSGREMTPDVQEIQDQPVSAIPQMSSDKEERGDVSCRSETIPSTQNSALSPERTGEIHKASQRSSFEDLTESIRIEEQAFFRTEITPEEQVQRPDDLDGERSVDANANITAMYKPLDSPHQESNEDELMNDSVFKDSEYFKPKISRRLTHDSVTSIDPYSTPGSGSDASDYEGVPIIVQRLKTLDVLEGQDAELVIRVRGNPEPQVRWFKDNIEVGNDGRTRVEQEDETWKLIIEGVVVEDDGKYLCKVQNEYGQDTSSAIIYVEPLTENEHNLLSDEGEHSEKGGLRWRESSIDRDHLGIEDEDEEDGQGLHGEDGRLSSDPDQYLHVSPVENEAEDVKDDEEEHPEEEDNEEQKDVLLDNEVTSEDQNDHGIDRPTSLTLTTTSTDGEMNVNQISEEDGHDKDVQGADDTSPSMPGNHVPARAKLLSPEQLLLGIVHEDKPLDNISADLDPNQEDSQLMETYFASAEYTPSPSNKENIPLVEGQKVEVLDSKSTSQWLIRTRDLKTNEIKQGWVPASHLTSMMHRSNTISGMFIRKESRIANKTEVDNKVDDGLSRKKAEAVVKRMHCIKDLVDGEREFVKDLAYCINHFIPPVEHPNVPAFLKGKTETIFCNIKDIHEFHKGTFLKELEMCENDADSIGKAFIKWAPKFDSLYVKYCQNMNRTVKNEMTPAVKDFFAQYGGRRVRKEMDIQSYLIKPVQRISRYTLIIKDLIKYTVRAKEDCRELQTACNVMAEVPKKADNVLTISLIEGFRGDVQKLGKMHRRDEFNVWHGKSKGRCKSRMVFLFDEMLMFTKVKRNSDTARRDHNKDPIAGYVYKSHIVIPGIEVARPRELNGDDRKFEVINEKPTFMHRTLQGDTSYVIKAWEKEILDLAEIAQLEGRKPLLIRNRTHSLIRRGSNRGSIRSIGSSPRSISGSLRSITGSLSSFNTSETGSMAPSIASNRSSIASDVFSPDSASNRASFVSYVSSNADQEVAKHSIEVGLYEITHNVVAQGVEGLEFSKGDIVKVLELCDDDQTFHIETIPTESFPYTKDGYIAREYLKKQDEEEEECAPDITVQAKSRTVTAGDTATFICQFTGNPDPEAEWNIPEDRVLDSRIEVITTRGCSTLIIYQAKKKDEREYTCTLSNQFGCVSCSAKLNVIEPSSARPTTMDVNSTNASESKIVTNKITLPLSFVHKYPSPDLTSNDSGGDEVKPLTVKNSDMSCYEPELVCDSTMPYKKTKPVCNSNMPYERFEPMCNSTMPYNSNTLPQQLKSTQTLLNSDKCCNSSYQTRAKLNNQATINRQCNRSEIMKSPWCFKQHSTLCQSYPLSRTRKPSVHYQSSAIDEIYMIMKQLLDGNRTDDAKLFERTLCATCKDNHSMMKVCQVCAMEEAKSTGGASADKFRRMKKKDRPLCHAQADRFLCVPDGNIFVPSTEVSISQYKPQAICVC